MYTDVCMYVCMYYVCIAPPSTRGFVIHTLGQYAAMYSMSNGVHYPGCYMWLFSPLLSQTPLEKLETLKPKPRAKGKNLFYSFVCLS